MKLKVSKECFRRLKKVLQSKLNGRNLVQKRLKDREEKT